MRGMSLFICILITLSAIPLHNINDMIRYMSEAWIANLHIYYKSLVMISLSFSEVNKTELFVAGVMVVIVW